MAAESSASNDPGQHQQVEALIDELISEILNSSDAAQAARSAGRGRSPAPVGGLLETVRSTMSRTASGASTLERLLVAEALAGILADAIAPALAEVLAPRIMKAMETTAETQVRTPGTRSHQTERTRKTDAK